MGKSWGKPGVFKKDREPMFGNGLVMTEGDEWVHRRHTITPAFSPSNLKVSIPPSPSQFYRLVSFISVDIFVR